MLSKSIIVLLSVAALPAVLLADVGLGAPFRDGVVLQRGKPVPVWGSASPGEQVKVEFHGQGKETTANAEGRWEIALEALPASADAAEMVVTGKNSICVKDVIVGEVWLCSGQSNMHLPVSEATNSAREIAQANDPLLREFSMKATMADAPQTKAAGEWRPSTPETVRSFTAVGYFFARELRRELKVPVGIVHATLGGSPIEAWMSQAALASDPAFAVVHERWEKMRAKAFGDSLRNQPSGLYHGFIAPLEPMALAGFAWYQGEGNRERAGEYAMLFRTMIAQWRQDFRQPELPFLFVQLPNFANDREEWRAGWVGVREAQASALALPHAAMAVTIDIGEPANLHPHNKQEVGRRLALQALAKVYGRAVECDGPVFAGATREGATLRVRFQNAAGLKIAGDPFGMFELAGADGEFVPAEMRIEGESVLVAAPAITQPEKMRFEWRDAPVSYLQNQSGLPAAPFRWP